MKTAARMLTETKPQSDAQIDEALAEAHLPSLMMSIVHLTGDATILSDDMKPVYDFFSDGRFGGLVFGHDLLGGVNLP